MKRAFRKTPEVVIAGPGAGKTCQMVQRIAHAIPTLTPVRFLAAITYTNAAADLIRSRLQEQLAIPPNVFVGTTHGFFSRFILSPYATLHGHLPADRVFMSIDFDSMIGRGGRGKRRGTPASRAIQRNVIMNALMAKGVVPFERMASVASALMEEPRIVASVCNRLQYLFIDEFQDVDTSQHRIFEAIVRQQLTDIYAVGDPEQYISTFTYKVRAARAPTFAVIPFFKFAKRALVKKETVNHRACGELVAFTNHFHSELVQTAERSSRGCQCVFFIALQELDGIIGRYRALTKGVRETKADAVRFYLAYEKKTFLSLKEQYGLTPASNDTTVHKSLLNEAVSLICSVLGRSRSALCAEAEIDLLGLRRLGVALLGAIRSDRIAGKDGVCEFVSARVKIEPLECGHVEDQLQGLRMALCPSQDSGGLERYSTIHKAKGLQAEAVLVVARTENELDKWLTTSREGRAEDRTDTCRIGYVAFSRAREVLCIACLKPVGDGLRAKLVSLGVEIV
jgi:DNA helicase-2/ATP-dependent DNA helicase PcrA